MSVRLHVGKVVIALLWMSQGLFSRAALAQGQIQFVTFLRATVDARVTFADGTPIPSTADYTAQLYTGAPGTALDSLVPAFPTERFRPDAPGYIFNRTATVTGRTEGQATVIVMRVYNATTWETSACRGESAPIEIVLGGGVLPPAVLIGLQPFSVNCIPEPGTIALLAMGALVFSSRKRAKPWRNSEKGEPQR